MINIPIPVQQTLSYFVFASVLQEDYIHPSHKFSISCAIHHLPAFAMFGKGRYFGLRGQALNLAVGIIAGIDFL
jgi:hypothetical protein